MDRCRGESTIPAPLLRRATLTLDGTSERPLSCGRETLRFLYYCVERRLLRRATLSECGIADTEPVSLVRYSAFSPADGDNARYP